MADDILKDLKKLEALSSGAPSSKNPTSATISQALDSLDQAYISAQHEIENGADPEEVMQRLEGFIATQKSETEKGLKNWYNGIARVGKSIDKHFHHEINDISLTYDSPCPLFSSDEATRAMDQSVVNLMARRGAWESVDELKKESNISFDNEAKRLHLEMHTIAKDLEKGDVDSALRWTTKHHAYLSSPPHPSPLPFYLHRARYISLLAENPPINSLSTLKGRPDATCKDFPSALQYAQDHFFPYLGHQPEVLRLLGASCFSFPGLSSSPYADFLSPELAPPALVPLFRIEFCRLHGWPKEDPLDVVIELGSSGALNKIEKARKVMQARMGDVRTWEEMPMELPLPPSRRYHSVFACPVSKEQATDVNPPKMLTCGHVIAHESLTKLSKHGRKIVKCPYCPQETPISSALRLYF